MVMYDFKLEINDKAGLIACKGATAADDFFATYFGRQQNDDTESLKIRFVCFHIESTDLFFLRK